MKLSEKLFHGCQWITWRKKTFSNYFDKKQNFQNFHCLTTRQLDAQKTPSTVYTNNKRSCSIALMNSWTRIPTCLPKISSTKWARSSCTYLAYLPRAILLHTLTAAHGVMPLSVRCGKLLFKCTCRDSFTLFVCIKSLANSMLFYLELTVLEKESTV